MEQKRSTFSGRLGFVLAAAGSAVGLGNIWRFPYLAARYGGGMFLLVYLVLAVTVGFSLMVAEIAIGRRTGRSAIGAFRALNRRFAFIGYLVSAVPFFILPYYCVVGGWVAKYWAASTLGRGGLLADSGYFDAFVSRPLEPLVWFFLFLTLTALLVLTGVEKGVEKVCKWMMPVLAVLSVLVAVYVLFLPGAGRGVAYYLMPDLSRFSIRTVLAAMGQMFFSMSLAMGVMITYGSYMKKEVNLHRAVRQIELFDTGIAFVSGLMVVPAVFAVADPQTLDAGPGLMFVTLPRLFDRMPGGHFVGMVFFLSVLLAALTSSISMMETVVSILQDRWGWSRRGICVAVWAVVLLAGVPLSLGYGPWGGFRILGYRFPDLLDFLTNQILMPVAALLTCLFVGYALGPRSLAEEARLKRGEAALFSTVMRYAAPVCILLILLTSLLSLFGVLHI